MVRQNEELKSKFQKVALFSTSKEKKIISIASQCKEVLLSKGLEVMVDKNFIDLDSSKLLICSEKEILNQADLLISIGGDGTMLKSSRLFGSKGIPVLGVNLGNLGFLADINPNHLTDSLLKVLEGKFIEDKRFFLKASISDGKRNLLALNEVVIHSGVIAKMIEYDLFIDDNFVSSQKADGLIISTNTGSTAYSFSGGGPIIHPSLAAFCILPMFPHSLSSSPLVVSSRSSIKITLKSSSQKGKISLDSAEIFSIKKGQEVFIEQSSKFLKLIHPKDHNFYEAYRNKLGWGLGITKD